MGRTASKLKKLSTVTLALMAGGTFAGTMGPAMTGASAWEVGVQALYLQPSYTGLPYYGSSSNVAGTVVQEDPENKWGWGYKLEGAYHFNAVQDITLSWYHFNRSSTVTPSGILTDNDSNTYTAATTVVRKPSWDAVNLEAGRVIDLQYNTIARIHVGVEYAHIDRFTSFYTTGTPFNLSAVTNVSTNVATSATQSISYSGFGPRFGVNLRYNWLNGLSVYGDGAGSLLVGRSKFTLASIQSSIGFTDYGSATTIVPELETKLGAMYTHTLGQGLLALDLGWMWVNYFNPLQTGSSGGGNSIDFGVQGPYVGLKWLGNS